jgi:hypothetical protein
MSSSFTFFDTRLLADIDGHVGQAAGYKSGMAYGPQTQLPRPDARMRVLEDH